MLLRQAAFRMAVLLDVKGRPVGCRRRLESSFIVPLGPSRGRGAWGQVSVVNCESCDTDTIYKWRQKGGSSP